VVDQCPTEETFVSPLQRAQGDVFLDIVLLASNVLQNSIELSVLSADRRREKPAQVEALAFLLGEGGRFVVPRIVEKREACEVVFGLRHVTSGSRGCRQDGGYCYSEFRANGSRAFGRRRARGL